MTSESLDPNAEGEDTARPSPEVVAVLVENHRRFLKFLERRVGSREAAEDILQDAFIRGLTRGSQIDDAESALAWFYRVLRNAIVDHWRRKGAEQRAVERAAVSGDERTDDPELMDTVCACAGELIDTLSPEYGTVLRRVDLNGASVKAFAEETGITANNASVRLFRARRALLKQVQRSCGTCADHGCLDCQCGGPGPKREAARA
jgi:RNA polymerase sigma-70 factor (ECF subfamily)